MPGARPLGLTRLPLQAVTSETALPGTGFHRPAQGAWPAWTSAQSALPGPERRPPPRCCLVVGRMFEYAIVVAVSRFSTLEAAQPSAKLT